MRRLAALILPLPLLGAADDRAALDAARRGGAAATARSEALAVAAEAAEARSATAADRLAALAGQVEASEAAMIDAEAGAAIAAASAGQAQARLADRRRPVAALVGALTTMARRPAALAMLQPGSIRDQVHLRAAITSMRPVIAARSAALQIEAARAESAAVRAARTLAAATNARAALARDSAALSAARQGALAAAATARLGAKTAGDRALAFREDSLELATAVDRGARDRRTLADLAALPAPSPRPGAGTAGERPPIALGMPAAGRIVRGFGEPTPSGGRAPGIHLAVPAGAAVAAPGAGRIAWAGRYRDYGGMVILDHGGGWMSIVSGLAEVAVPTGRRVDAGAPLGRAEGGRRPLAIELRRDGRPVALAPLVSRG